MEQKKLKWKDVYESNKQRRFCEVTGIKEENVEIESNSYKVFLKRKYIIIFASLIATLLIVWTFRNNIKVLLMVLAFFAIVGIGFFVFTYYKFKCLKDGLYVKFGFQQGKFKYDKIKAIYLSKYNDYSFLLPTRRRYSIVIRYEDNLNRLRELSFPNYFLTPEQTAEFLNNFIIKETQEEKYVQYERFKILKKIGKVVLVVLFLLFIIGTMSK